MDSIALLFDMGLSGVEVKRVIKSGVAMWREFVGNAVPVPNPLLLLGLGILLNLVVQPICFFQKYVELLDLSLVNLGVLLALALAPAARID